MTRSKFVCDLRLPPTQATDGSIRGAFNSMIEWSRGSYISGMLRCNTGSSASALPAPRAVQAMGLSAT